MTMDVHNNRFSKLLNKYITYVRNCDLIFIFHKLSHTYIQTFIHTHVYIFIT